MLKKLSFISIFVLITTGCQDKTTPNPVTPKELLISVNSLELKFGQSSSITASLLMSDNSTQQLNPAQVETLSEPANLLKITSSDALNVESKSVGTGSLKLSSNGLTKTIAIKITGKLIPNQSNISLIKNGQTNISFKYEDTNQPVPIANIKSTALPNDLLKLEPNDSGIKISALKVGKGTISFESSLYSASLDFDVKETQNTVSSLEITADPTNLDALGAKLNLKLVAKDSLGQVVPGITGVWASSSSDVLDINGNNSDIVELIAKKNGSSEISVQANGLSAKKSFFVDQKAAKINTSFDVINMVDGESKNLEAKIVDRLDNPMPGSITWGTNSSIITLNTIDGNNVKIDAKDGGNAVVKASFGSINKEINVSVQKVAKIQFDDSALMLFSSLGEIKSTIVKGYDAAGKVIDNLNIAFDIIGNQNIVSKEQSGVNGVRFTAVGNGSAEVEASFKALKVRRSIKVEQLATKLLVNPDSYMFSALNLVQNFQAKMVDARGNALTGDFQYQWKIKDNATAFDLSINGAVASVKAISGNAISTLLQVQELKTGKNTDVSISIQIGSGSNLGSFFVLNNRKSGLINPKNGLFIAFNAPGEHYLTSCAISGGIGALLAGNNDNPSVYRVSSNDNSAKMVYQPASDRRITSISSHPTNKDMVIISEQGVDQSDSDILEVNLTDGSHSLYGTTRGYSPVLAVSNGQTSLFYLYNGQLIRVTNGASKNISRASSFSVSTKNEEVAVVINDQVVLMDFNGQIIKNLVPAQRGTIILSTSFSPDGQTIFYSRNIGSNSSTFNIYGVSRSGSIKNYGFQGQYACVFN